MSDVLPVDEGGNLIVQNWSFSDLMMHSCSMP